MKHVILALGLVLAVEGLALALAPSRFMGLVAMLARLGHDRRRLIGLLSLALGVVLVALARHLGV